MTFAGVLCATFGIFWLGAKLEWKYIFFGGFGSVFGIILGKILVTGGGGGD